jgi:hypothetical protein
MIVQKVRHRSRTPLRPEQELQRQLVAALKSLLTPATFFVERDPAVLAAPGVRAGMPDLAFIHQGRAFHLELMAPGGYLTALQRAAHVALRDAGARVEVARTLPEALAHIRGFGIPLKDVSIQTVFRKGELRRAQRVSRSGGPAKAANA